MTIFDILKDVLTTKKGNLHESPDFSKVYSNYMLARYLSMRSELIQYGQWLNQYGTVMSSENCYKFLVKMVPKSKVPYIQYLKSKKEVKEKEAEE